ncbi:hypothetical protein QQP08_016511 [Theobroma cacao]|nr:hypothetical protein QQP08_016511 [Theobroma cacao]
MVIKEFSRLHPLGALLLPREPMSQFNIVGYNVYPKTRILFVSSRRGCPEISMAILTMELALANLLYHFD